MQYTGSNRLLFRPAELPAVKKIQLRLKLGSVHEELRMSAIYATRIIKGHSQYMLDRPLIPRLGVEVSSES